jgi:DNA topoisomerase-1
MEHDFQCKYTIADNSIKKKQIELLRKAIKETDEVIIATDDDREGEAIAWHICQLFHLNIEKTKRILFHEITESALQKAIQHPITINMNIVYAQQARQILDLLVGFRISPILWKCISAQCKKSLSAGRCQTPALKMVYDNYLDIQNTQERKVYNTTGYFTNMHLPFELSKQYESEEEMVEFLEGSCEFNHLYSVNVPISLLKSPPEPFTTSRLQQTASNELHFSPKETMKICQHLYEEGYITYMRTDSTKYSEEFIGQIRQYILKKYDETYIHEALDSLSLTNAIREKIVEELTQSQTSKKTNTNKKSKTNTEPIQSAHEAIRPTNISLFELPDNMDNKE